jgi:acyl-ACP thioesterase
MPRNVLQREKSNNRRVTMNNSITTELSVRYMDTSFSMKTDLVTVLSYFNEVAQVAGDYYETQYDIFREESLAWLLLNWQVHIRRFPEYKENVVLKTVAHAIDRFYAYRSFYILDPVGTTIVEAKSRWILMDFSTRRVTGAKPYMSALYGLHPESLPYEVDDPATIDEVAVLDRKTVSPSDIDIYGHVNNVVYARWICDVLKPRVSSEKKIKEFRIRYKKEASLGDNVIIASQTVEEGKPQTNIRIQREGGGILAFSSIFWRGETE